MHMHYARLMLNVGWCYFHLYREEKNSDTSIHFFIGRACISKSGPLQLGLEHRIPTYYLSLM